MTDVQAELAAARARIEELELALADHDRREAVQVALYRIAAAASAVDELPEFYAEIHEIVASLMYGENFYLALYDDERGYISFPYYRDREDVEVPNPILWEPIGTGNASGLTAFVLRTGMPQRVTTERQAALEAAGEVSLIGAPSEDWLGVPLRSEGRTIGVLVVQTYRPGEHYTDDDERLLTFVAQHIATALDRVRARAEVRRRNAELAVVNEVAEALARQLDFDAIMAAVGERAAQAIAADGLSIAIADEVSGEIRFLYWLDQGIRRPELEGRVLDDVLSARIVSSGEPIRVGSAAEAASIGAPFKVGGTESYLGVPIPTAERTIGVIAIGTGEANAYGIDDERLLSTLATNMGVALENARLFAETKRLLAETGRQKQYFERLVEISPVAVVTMDRGEIVSGWNPAATTLFGYAPEEAIGRHIDELVLAPEERDEGAAAVRQVDEAGRIQQIGQRRRRDGRLVDVEIVAVPLRVDDEHVGYYAIYHDISELVAARREADAANEAKGTFLASMSHEIRTPMNAIIGMSGLLLQTPLGAEQRDFAETIGTSAEALLTIINDILDFSKIEAGHIDLEATPYSPVACIKGALDVVATSAASKDLELVYDIGPDLPQVVVGDAGRLRQIVINLLSNAVKFTEAGSVVLSVSGRRLEHEDRGASEAARWELSVTVSDTGIGIAPDRMDRLFKSFSQADASISRRYGGTGLGLAISQRLAGLQGGAITAESRGIPGEGSRFTLRIVAPEAPAEAVAAVPQPIDGPTSTAVLGERHPLRILLAEDNAVNQKLALRLLQQLGYTAVVAANGLEVIAALETDVFDLVLMDVQMPELDGLEATRRIRHRWPGREGPYIVAMTANAMAGDRELCLAAGMDGYVSKPIRVDELVAALESAPALGVRERADV